jgi:biotin-[acetyl-CoA-carboxylase] ligase BirA-like protein
VQVQTNDPASAARLLGDDAAELTAASTAVGAGVRALAAQLLGEGVMTFDAASPDPLWRHALVSRHSLISQYDTLIAAARADTSLPDGLVCVAADGARFHGLRGRPWAGSRGNIHLSVHLAPGRPVERFETVFMALAAVSVVETLDRIAGLGSHARIRWVNDVLLHGAKAAGVLAYTQTRGPDVLSVILGIGINVEVTPAVVPTPFVPTVTSLRAHAANPGGVTAGSVLRILLRTLAHNYRGLLAAGGTSLTERYRARSMVIGREVAISTDPQDGAPRVFASGHVSAIGAGLELWLDGQERPITSGRLILGAERAAGEEPNGHAPTPGRGAP